eukprot:1409669-Pleurochrysis_carterae.AAC.3
MLMQLSYAAKKVKRRDFISVYMGDISSGHYYSRGATSCSASARCVLRGFVSETQPIDETSHKQTVPDVSHAEKVT